MNDPTQVPTEMSTLIEDIHAKVDRLDRWFGADRVDQQRVMERFGNRLGDIERQLGSRD